MMDAILKASFLVFVGLKLNDKNKSIYLLSGDVLLDSWRGASWWASNQDNRCHFISRTDYQEMGGDFLREHIASNTFVPYR